ncbi:succinate-semialdehyde dehydrogenase/glutarate-semialdehyde dehydrogenase [Paraburkholderia sp. WC7.3g]|uniref:NAD-dependent succinate-semialdehyde dehydrogenase n=1 Tax=Paraburkholderia podalyriae TaxID=1938811 RepID=A0ABR7PZB9_9BURK|nr:NAD-dependent succinate-semialdehyde dehydrogenase [Paraburkholderia podalyriae]MBC8751534.1 NAD-dependent succinate-semialdehyde dehydrogenase [Paraburkholderia podalyriae]
MSYPKLRLFIDGQWIDKTDEGTVPVVNPADGEVLGHLPIAGRRELERAADAARRSFSRWASMLPLERFRIISTATALMRERSREIAHILTLEQGKPLAEAVREVTLSADIIEFLAEEAKRLPIRGVPARISNVLSQTVTRVPVGPVAAFTPWNFPANLPSRKLGGALAAGCSVVIKPAEETPATCMAIVECLVDAGMPEGVVNLVAGDPAFISSSLISSPQIAKISFTGSVRVGRLLGEQAARHVKRYTAELGGHAPVIVCKDYEGAKAARLAVPAKFRNAGQVCASPIRFIVHRAQYEAFRDEFVKGALSLKIGSGFEEGVQFGPLIESRRVQEMQAFVDDAATRGATIACGGKRVNRSGYFFEPTVIEHASLDSRVQNEEPFGPIAVLDVFDDLDDAISRANRLPVGLAAYAFTGSLDFAHRLSSDLQAGMVGINHFGVSQPETPFGGVKESGLGHESGLEGLLGYTDLKLISVAQS